MIAHAPSLAARPFAARAAAPVLRRCACGGAAPAGGECAECKRKRLQRAPSAGGPAVAPAVVHDVLRSPGAGLDGGTRAMMEPRFGHSFADVRVHADSRAAESAAAVGARAYTVGRSVVFGGGMYQPRSEDGRRLIAHELAHVVQQSGSGSTALQASLEVGPADAPEEREAERAADAVMRGGGVSMDASGAATLRRAGGPGSVTLPPRPPGQLPPVQPAPGTGAVVCDATRQAQVDAARAAGAIRAVKAYHRAAGVGPEGGEDRMTARRLAQKMFGNANPDLGAITDVVGKIAGHLAGGGLAVRCADAADPLCGAYGGYAVDKRAPIYLCPGFFTSSDEERVRTMIHETAHVSGVGNPKSETYCIDLDCETSCGGMDSADSFTHFIHCLSGATPDQPITKSTP